MGIVFNSLLKFTENEPHVLIKKVYRKVQNAFCFVCALAKLLLSI